MACARCNRPFPSGWYQAPAMPELCGQVQCKACGEMRCHSDGTGRGTCRACCYGILPGWSGSEGTCSYAKCKAPAVYAYLPGGKRYACRAHGEKILTRRNAA